MTLKYLKSCDSWMACAAQGTKGEVGIESADERRTLYQYVFYGSVKIAEPFSDSSKTLELTKGKLFDTKELLGKHVFSLENDGLFVGTFGNNSDVFGIFWKFGEIWGKTHIFLIRTISD